jgi:hypothetical protein
MADLAHEGWGLQAPFKQVTDVPLQNQSYFI